MNMDILTVVSAGIGFILFLTVHVISFRRIPAEGLLRSLVVCTLSVSWFPAMMISIIYLAGVIQISFAVWLSSITLATFLLGLLCFVYVLCIFGPYETSVRMRLIREIAGAEDKGISLDELLQRYNAEIITRIRLKRLMGSGDVIEKAGFYKLGRQGNFFFIFKAIARIIQKCIAK